jgi:hypothetical protein
MVTINLAMAIHAEAKGCVKLKSRRAPTSNIGRGVIQGGSMSPALFIIVLHMVMVIARLPPFNNSACRTKCLGYADDLIAIFRDKAGATGKMTAVCEASALSGLSVNETKTCLVEIKAATPVVRGRARSGKCHEERMGTDETRLPHAWQAVRGGSEDAPSEMVHRESIRTELQRDARGEGDSGKQAEGRGEGKGRC